MSDSVLSVLKVRSQFHDYEVLIGNNISGTLGMSLAALPSIRAGSVGAVITDSNVAPLYAEAVLQSLWEAGFIAHLVVFPAGERSKSLERVSSLAESLIGYGLDRRSLW